MSKSGAIQAAIRELKTNWRKGRSLKEVAADFGVDAGNLDRAFRKQEGMPTKEFLDSKRKEQLLLLLKERTRYGHEIGTELGFPNGFAFYRWVKRAFGVSLAELRKRAKQ